MYVGAKDFLSLTIFSRDGSAVQYVDLRDGSIVVSVTRRGHFMLLSWQGSDQPSRASFDGGDGGDVMTFFFMFENVTCRGNSNE